MEDTQLPISGPMGLYNLWPDSIRLTWGHFAVQDEGPEWSLPIYTDKGPSGAKPPILVGTSTFGAKCGLELFDLLHTNLGWGLNLDAPNNVSFYSESSPSVVRSDV